MKYFVCLGTYPEAGPFTSYDEADREREHITKGRRDPSLYTIKTLEESK